MIRFDTYDKPGRDPRGRTITQVFVLIWNEKTGIPEAGSDAKIPDWFELTELPELAFDHYLIVTDAINLMKNGTT